MKESLNFTLRKDRPNNSGECPLYLRYTFNRKFVNIPTGITLKANEWDNSLQIPIKPLKEQRVLISELDIFKTRISTRIENFKGLHGRAPSHLEIPEVISTLPKKKSASATILELFQKFINEKVNNVNPAVQTVKVYRGTLKKWKEFEKENGVKYLDNMTKATLSEFRTFLFNKDLQPNTIGKYVKTFKAFLNYAVDEWELEIPPSFSKIKVDREEAPIEVLTIDELELLKYNVFYSGYSKVFSASQKVKLTDEEKQIGQIFCLLCSTGLSYADFLRFTVNNIFIEQDKIEKKWNCSIRIGRQKLSDKSECKIPILDVTIDLLLECLGHDRKFWEEDGGPQVPFETKVKYLKGLLKSIENGRMRPTNYPHFFPNLTNQYFNREIKNVCKKVGIQSKVVIKKKIKNRIYESYVPKYEIVSSHMGRRTYITQSLNKGVRHDVIMKSTGHTNYDTFRKYIKYTDAGVNDEYRSKIKNKPPEE